MLFFWVLIFILSLALLLKSADWIVESSEKIAIALKVSPFIIGVTVVAVGTSFPELAASLSAVFKGVTEVVTANVIGSNLANILLIVGFSAVIARPLIVKRSLIDLDAPLLAVATVLFAFIIWDKNVVFWEGVLLILGFLIYLLYTFFRRKEKEEEKMEFVEVLPSRVERREKEAKIETKEKIEEVSEGLNFKPFLFLIFGLVGVIVGANYTIESVLKISEILKVSPSLIAITVVAVGTSLPELVVSIQAAAKKKYEVALGNVFGSNVFNILIVTGIPALIHPLIVDKATFNIGFPFLIAVTLLFVISGISRRIHVWEGLMYLLIYILFIAKLYNLF